MFEQKSYGLLFLGDDTAKVGSLQGTRSILAMNCW
jgi:hypothetical protein